MTLLSPKEIREENKAIGKAFSESQIGSLLWLGLVRGRKLRRSCEVCLEDVEKVHQLALALKK